MLNVAGYFDPLLAFIGHAVGERFVRPEHGAMIAVSTSATSLLDMLAEHRPPAVETWIERAQT
jgi:predicted Rossmann-fold nucleotide-binding protein